VRLLLAVLPAALAQTNCAFSAWSDWSLPGVQPNPTTCYRIRSIDTPASGGGTDCVGPTGQSKTCDPFAPLSAEVLQLDTANCVLDSLLAAGFLAKASFQIMEAIAECPNTKAGCSSEISKATGSFLSVGSFISSTVTACPAIKNANAACSRDIIGLLAALAGVSARRPASPANSWQVHHQRLPVHHTSREGRHRNHSLGPKLPSAGASGSLFCTCEWRHCFIRHRGILLIEGGITVCRNSIASCSLLR